MAYRPPNPEETLEQIKQSITVDEGGMFIMLGNRIVITPQGTFGNMMRSAADLGGINLARSSCASGIRYRHVDVQDHDRSP